MAIVSVNNGNIQAASQPKLATDDGMAVASTGPYADHFHLTPNR